MAAKRRHRGIRYFHSHCRTGDFLSLRAGDLATPGGYHGGDWRRCRQRHPDKTGEALQQAKEIDTVVLDKTEPSQAAS